MFVAVRFIIIVIQIELSLLHMLGTKSSKLVLTSDLNLELLFAYVRKAAALFLQSSKSNIPPARPNNDSNEERRDISKSWCSFDRYGGYGLY